MASVRFWSAIFLLAVWTVPGFGLRQELWLHMHDGNGLYFNTNLTDMTKYTSLLPTVKTYCSSGAWAAFKGTGFSSYYTLLGNASMNGVHCGPMDATNMRSIRFLGASDTSESAITLYAGGNFDGIDLLVRAKAYTGINRAIGSLAVTGKSDWMLYEGQLLDGKSTCYKIPAGSSLNYNSVSGVGLATIGSVYKGCDLLEIKTYRNAHLHV